MLTELSSFGPQKCICVPPAPFSEESPSGSHRGTCAEALLSAAATAGSGYRGNHEECAGRYPSQTTKN